jgi:ABC-2 type transport system ATP-binding protein
VVILDEPMSGLDPMGRMEVRNLIRELKGAGKTVFFSSHILSDVEALCDRVVMIHRGRKIAEGSVEELMGKEGIQYVEVVFSPPPPPGWVSASGLPPESGSVQGDTFVLKARDHEEANHWIGECRRVGSLVTSCIPVKKRLEEIYVQQVGGNTKGDGGGG